MAISWHEEAPDELRESIRFTAETTGFAPRLIEKDYFCSVILEALAREGTPLVFKGGTCLAKIHSGFFRLSEDLDFSVATSPEATRRDRRLAMAPIREVVDALPARAVGLELLNSLEGHNESKQYLATIGYRSLLAPRTETIDLEVGLREPILTPPESGQVRTMARHWARGDSLLETFAVRCLSYREAMAEKLRAALTRREPAIRDFFDIDHAVGVAGFDPGDPPLLRLLGAKLATGDAGAVDVSPERLDELRSQLDARLRPVLRGVDFDRFDLERAFGIVRGVAECFQ